MIRELSLGCTLIRVRRASPEDGSNLTSVQNTSSESPDWLGEGYDESQDACYSLYFLLNFFNLYYIPLIILIGLVGNLLSCIVFLNTHLKMRSSSYYLAALASADFGFLFSLLLVWLDSNFGWQVYHKAGFCEALVYVSSVCSSLSVWLIVAFTVERFIAVQYPLHRPYMCTTARAKTIVLALVLLALGSHSYVFVVAGVVTGPDGFEFCQLRMEYHEAMRIINIVDSIASLIAPLILIILMNTMITVNLIRFSRRFKQGSGVTHFPIRERSDINLNQIPNASSSNNGAVGLTLVPEIGWRRNPSLQQSFHSSKSNNSHQSRQMPQTTSAAIYPRCTYGDGSASSRNPASPRNQQNTTKMLLLISTVFILLNLPSYVIRLCVFFFDIAGKERPMLLWCIQQFFMLLYYTNFSINFALYAMCGITFRRCLKQLMCKVQKSITSPVVSFLTNIQRWGRHAMAVRRTLQEYLGRKIGRI